MYIRTIFIERILVYSFQTNNLAKWEMPESAGGVARLFVTIQSLRRLFSSMQERSSTIRGLPSNESSFAIGFVLLTHTHTA